MRIIGGSRKGRVIKPEKSFKARPTTDFSKENLFNIINNHFYFEDINVLDLFSGTGSISYEFASRGSTEIDMVESNYRHYSFIKKTIEQLDFNQIEVIKGDAFRFIRNCYKKYDIIFADPPFDLKETVEIPDLIFEYELLKKEGWLILEHSRNNNFSDHPSIYDKREYGSVNFSIFKNI